MIFIMKSKVIKTFCIVVYIFIKNGIILWNIKKMKIKYFSHKFNGSIIYKWKKLLRKKQKRILIRKKIKKNPDKKKLTRTISTWNSSNHNQTKILRFMSWESKNIYNTSAACIFSQQVTGKDMCHPRIVKLCL